MDSRQVCYQICGLLLLLWISPLKGLKTTAVLHEEKVFTDFGPSEISAISRRASQALARWYSYNQKADVSSRRERSITPYEIKCDQESLEAIVRMCESAAAASVKSLHSANSRQERNDNPASFCGQSCSNLVFTYVNICGLQEFILNVSGACKLEEKDFTVDCIHAVVVVKPGIVSCTKMLQESVSHDIKHLVDPSKLYQESQCCSLRTYHNSSLPGHDIIFDRKVQKFRVEPPLVPPWRSVNVSEYPPILDVTTSPLCIQKATTPTVSRTNELTTPGLVTQSGTYGTIFRPVFMLQYFLVFICLHFALLLVSQIN